MNRRNEKRRSTDSPLWKVPVEDEVHDEVDLHLALLRRDFEAEGHSPEDARRLAAQKFGDRESFEKACLELAGERDRRRNLGQSLAEIRDDLVSAVKQMHRNKVFATVVIAGLAIGLGITIATFAWVDQLLLEPLPFSSPEGIVTLWEAQPHRGQDKNVVGPANFLAWTEESTSFEQLAGFITTATNLTGDGPPLRVKSRIVTPHYFEILGIPAAKGRTLEEDDWSGEAIHVTVLSHGFWQSRFGGRGDIVGQNILLDGRRTTIVGVMPPEADLDLGPLFRPYTDAPDLYQPLPMSERWREARGRWLLAIGRLHSGIGVDEAQNEMTALSQALEERWPDFNGQWTVNLMPLDEHLRESSRQPVLMLFGAVLLVMLLLGVNLASLMLTRTSARTSELAVRSALGAGRLRLVRQLLLEGGALTAVAGVAGLLLALALIRLGRLLLPPDLALDELPRLGVPTLVFAAVLALASSLTITVWPALLTTRRPAGLLRVASLGGRGRMRTVLVFAEVALATILLVGAGLMTRTVFSLLNVDPGFESEDRLSFSVQLPRGTARSEQFTFFDRLAEGLEQLPGVASVGAVSSIPIGGGGAATSYHATDRPAPSPGSELVADIRVIRGDYLQTLDVELLEGRPFDLTDEAGDEQGVVVIDRTVAEQLWPDASAIGQELLIFWGDADTPRRIVGVVDSVRVSALDTAPRGTIYFPHAQEPESGLSFVLRTEGDPDLVLKGAREVVEAIDPGLPIYADTSLAGVIDESLSQQRFISRSLGLFALAALLIAAFGIYGVTSFSVLQRHREIGLRMALGATPKGVAGLVVGQVGRLAILAVVTGLAIAVLLGRYVESLLYGVEPFDPLTLCAVAALLAVSAVLAALRPALKAADIAPVRALRL